MLRRTDALPDEERGTSALLSDVGVLLTEVGRLDEAEDLFAQALEARRTAYGATDPRTLTSLNHMGLLQRQQGRMEEAAQTLAEAVSARRQVQGEHHPETLTAVNNLGVLLKVRASARARHMVGKKKRLLAATELPLAAP